MPKAFFFHTAFVAVFFFFFSKNSSRSMHKCSHSLITLNPSLPHKLQILATYLLKLQTNVFNCLLDISNWRSVGHLLLNVPKEKVQFFTEHWSLDFLSLWLASPITNQNWRVILHPSFSLSCPPPNLIRTKVHTLPKTIHHNLLGLWEPSHLYFANPYWSLKYQSPSFFTIICWDYSIAPEQKHMRPYFLTIMPKPFFS